MTKQRIVAATIALLLLAPVGAQAQGTSPVTRSGATAGSGSGTTSAGRATPATSGTSTGTSRSREGAMGMTPQLQREVGIKKQR
ncbi:hypothetical protein J6500_26905 [Bradyrhizobium sp. WSM 1704]|uniref:hypothetical protein n=1 Tax=Bradyrhizobium semiaridum TaxID=2821404 RepID=UPI001CE2E444|nr:hypothetical protein [Bradyrhizobium semiaridum]MCA6125498.1 hypothetical protein [Bradyrhizobium semiaridum]